MRLPAKITVLFTSTAVLGGLLALQPSPAPAQEVIGVVAWKTSRAARAIGFAAIRLCPAATATTKCRAAVAGSDGSFTVSGVAPGRYTIQASFDGGAIERTIEVRPGQRTVFVELITAK